MNGEMLVDNVKVNKRWAKYFEDLFNTLAYHMIQM